MTKHFALLFLLPLHLSAQEAPSADVTLKYSRPKYYELGAGLGLSGFRDFATSPLVYSGVSGQFVLGVVRKDQRLESDLAFRYSSGVYSTATDRRDVTSSVVNSVFLSYSRLYRFGPDSGRWNFKAGGKIDLTGNLRQNVSLENNGLGIETFQTLSGSVKATRDMSRNELMQKKFLFIRYKLKPKKREFSLQVNAPVLNTTFRNGYAYLNQSSITGSNKLFENYKFSAFSGFRMSSALQWTRYLKNGNGIKYSYLWDAYKTGGDLPKFEMSHHTLQVSLLFRVK